MPSKIIEPPMSTSHELWVGFDMGTDHVRCNNNVIGAHGHEGGTSGETGAVTGCVTTIPSGLLGDTSISTKTVMPAAGVFENFRAALKAGKDKAERFRELRLTEAQFDELLRWREVTLGYGYPGLPVTMEEAERLGFLNAPAEDDTAGIALAAQLARDEAAAVKAMDSDAPGIAAMAAAAKSVKPAPEPILSIGGSEFNTAELLEALALVRAKHAPQVKETPRGLMVVRELDHRLGLWGGEGC